MSDAVERGRSGWAMYPEIFQGEPIFLTKADPWERFRIGAGPGSWRTRTALPGTQFPTEAYDDFMRQVVPRWITTDAAQRQRRLLGLAGEGGGDGEERGEQPVAQHGGGPGRNFHPG